jgi:hypothetical protein
MLVLVVALAVVKTWQPLQTTFNEARLQETLPAGAVAWIEEHQPEGKMFNHYNWGGYLIWQLWPDYRVFVDGRTDLYGNDLLRNYLKVQAAQPGFDHVLDAYDVDWVLMLSGGALSTQLACRTAWSEVYQDDVATIWIRSLASQDDSVDP